MSSRDRSLLALIAVVLVAVAGYFIAVAPVHHTAAKLVDQISSERSALSEAEAQLAAGQRAEAQYATYARQLGSIARAVPSDTQIPGLINELQSASDTNHVSFQELALGGTKAAGSGTASAAGSTATSFPSQSFTLSFTGNYYAVANLLGTLAGFVRADDRNFRASGRLLSVGSVTLAPGSSGTSTTAGEVTASVNAQDYDVPSALITGAAGDSSGASSAASGS